MYVTYEYYLGTYGGRHVTADAFPNLALRAESWLHFLTFNRVTLDKVTETVKTALCEVIDALEKLDQTDGKIVSQESVGTSQSMSYDLTQRNPEYGRAKSIFTRYLGHTGLMYRGV